MANDPINEPIHQVRRKDRAKDDAWIGQFLKQAPSAVVATVCEGRPFTNTNLFVYDEPSHAIYFHTSKVGRVFHNVTQDGQVCLTAHRIGRLLPADTALEFSVEYSSVVVFGRAHVVNDEAEAERALQKLLDKYFPHLQPGQNYRPITPEELRRTAVYRIDIESWSGKQKKADPDFPGAFLYDWE
jgi:nitroimidazol reductase NimA-like FMN-containing flavoprotein (pyridoxamine 5'-phosphate oxidase superfamily)